MTDRIAKYYKVAEWPDEDGYLVASRNKEGKWGSPTVFGPDKLFNSEEDLLNAFLDGRPLTLELHVEYSEAYFKWFEAEVKKEAAQESKIILRDK